MAADTAAEALQGAEEGIREYVFPPAEGGKWDQITIRLESALDIISERQFSPGVGGHLGDEMKAFSHGFGEYAAGMMKDKDPVVRFLGDVLAGDPISWSPVQSIEEWKAAEHKLIVDGIDLRDAVPANSPSGAMLRGKVVDVLYDLTHSSAGRVDLSERLLNPGIQTGDVRALLSSGSLPNVWGFSGPDFDSQVADAGRYYRLYEKELSVLKAHRDEPGVQQTIRRIENSLDQILDKFRERFARLQATRDSLKASGQAAETASVQGLIDRYLEALPMLAGGPGGPEVRVRMLLTAKDWPLPWDWRREEGWPHARAQCAGGLIWIVFTDNETGKLGLVGLDPGAQGPAAVWQATGVRGGLNWLHGFVLGERHTYVTCDNIHGILVFPGTSVRGKGVIGSPKILGAEDGLPAPHIQTIAGTPEKMWVGFGDVFSESGLGLYNAQTGAWQTIFSNVQKGADELTSGQEYEIDEIAVCAGKVLFSPPPRPCGSSTPSRASTASWPPLTGGRTLEW